MNVIECYDIGGTRIHGAILKDGKELFSKKVTTDQSNFLSQIEKISKEFSKYGNSRIVSIGVPGPVIDGTVLAAPPLGVKKELDIRLRLEKILDKKVFVENDLNLATKAELHYGYGRFYKNFYLLTISTGIGSGIVLEGKPVLGTSGEFGHNVLNVNAEDICSCGHHGCWFAYSSGKGIERRYQRLAGKRVSCKEVFDLSNRDKITKKLVADARLYNAVGIGAMINALQMDAIIVMGSLGLKQFSKVIPSRNEIKEFTINKVPEIFPTKLEEKIGVLGAYVHGMEVSKK